MKSSEIRKRYLDFYKKHGHTVYDSAPLVPNDPTLLFTVAGMVPFKPFFLGTKVPENPRAASAQRCIRTNDIENIGKTARHLTFFEMLGNFSFGDYFKEEAIKLGWELTTKELGIPADKLIISVYEDDADAYNIWKNIVGIPEDKIKKLGKEENFWEGGNTGPCGPSTEIYYCFDGLNDFDPDSSRFIEIYNLVFAEFNKNEDGSYDPLPRKNIDTGMGLERAAIVLQGVESVFETDLIKPITDKIRSFAKKSKPEAEYIIADHLRSASWLIADGVLPSNEKRGYVLRRLIRRAAKYGFELGIKETFLYKLVNTFVGMMGFEELDKAEDMIVRVFEKEEKRFAEVLERGLEFVEAEISQMKFKKEKEIDAKTAFQLYDTYGFPFELTKEILEEHGMSADEEKFAELFKKHQNLSRSSANFENDQIAEGRIEKLFEQFGETMFVGYTDLEAKAKLLDEFEQEHLEMVFDQTPFYAESGGQVADSGTISSKDFEGEVIDVQKTRGVFVHFVKPLKGIAKKGHAYTLKVDEEARNKTKANHTATHLMHSAIQEVFGREVHQAGSLVTSDRLRLDVSSPQAITDEQIILIERSVNRQILEDREVFTHSKKLNDAKAMGAKAYFEDKYGDIVRVIEVPNFSIELCGGTHVGRTGEIGLFKIISEKGLSGNTRRIEAITGQRVVDYTTALDKRLDKISSFLSVPKDAIETRIEKMSEDISEMKRKLGHLNAHLLKGEIESAVSNAKDLAGYKLIKVETSPELFKKAHEFAKNIDQHILILVSNEDGIHFGISLSDNLAKQVSAGSLMKTVLEQMGKKGGGRSDFAQTKVDTQDHLEVLIGHMVKGIKEKI